LAALFLLTNCENGTHNSGGYAAFRPFLTPPARWEDSSVPVRRFRVEARPKETLFAEIEGAVRKFQGKLVEGRLEEKAAHHLTGHFTIQLQSPEDAAKIIRHIRGIPAVFSIQAAD
jgi:GTP pyrophosphokinase